MEGRRPDVFSALQCPVLSQVVARFQYFISVQDTTKGGNTKLLVGVDVVTVLADEVLAKHRDCLSCCLHDCLLSRREEVGVLGCR